MPAHEGTGGERGMLRIGVHAAYVPRRAARLLVCKLSELGFLVYLRDAA